VDVQTDTPLAAAFPEPEALLRIRVRPGSRFSYSNMGYTLLGMIIEAVTGERYETWLERQLLPPLSMHDSTFLFTTQEGDGADPTLAWGHVDDGSRYAASPVFLRPAGQFTTTAGDFAVHDAAFHGDGRPDARKWCARRGYAPATRRHGTDDPPHREAIRQIPHNPAARPRRRLRPAILRRTGNRRSPPPEALVLTLFAGNTTPRLIPLPPFTQFLPEIGRRVSATVLHCRSTRE
jgi:CubicO group peptidase (beta-lactamase class C family)